MSWNFDLRDGAQELRPFGYLGFRYLEVAGHGEPLGPEEVRIDARHASFPDEQAARFETSSPTLDAVWELARHSALYGSQEQFVDTPTREKGPFLGDSFDISQAAMAAFGDRALTSQGLRDFARSQARYWSSGADRGRVNVVYPNGDGKRDIPDATQTFPEWVWQAYWTTGDRDELASLYPVVRNITDYVARAIDPGTGLVTRLPGGGSDYRYGAVDWPPWMRFGYDMKTAARTMMNVLAVVDFRRAAAMARELGRPDEVETQLARAEALTRAIQDRLTRPDGVLVDGLYGNGKPSAHASQQANAWALAFGVVPASQQQAVADHVVSLGNAMGVVYFRVLLDALHEAGRDDALVAALTDASRPGYAQILERGATFTWESWSAPEVGDSESHGWGAAVLAVLQEHVLGIHLTAPGAASVDVRVPATSLTWASGVVATQRGPIPIAWTRDPDGRVAIDVEIPVGVTATVHLPAGSLAGVNEGGGSVTGAAGISDARVSRGEVVLTVGSGRYRFASSPPARE
jgi:alpha-L-rhamnosidase